VAYFAFNLGAWLTKEDNQVYGGLEGDPPPKSFIVDTDSLHGRSSSSTYLLVHFILEIARRLELWIAPYLALCVGNPLPEPPDYDAIVCEAQDSVKK
jgi:hypothetical protein